MDKQMIEEMARIIAFDLCPKRRIHANYGEEAQCYSDNNFAECKEIKNVVDKLINAGYRKITENAVVLTREEYDNMFSFKTTRGGFYNILDTVRKVERKETAEKFAERLKKVIHERDYVEGYAYLGICEEIDEICKEIIGEEIANAVKGVQNGN
jgi:hypothetical protein